MIKIKDRSEIGDEAKNQAVESVQEIRNDDKTVSTAVKESNNIGKNFMQNIEDKVIGVEAKAQTRQKLVKNDRDYELGL